MDEDKYWYDTDTSQDESIKRLLAISIGDFQNEWLQSLPSAVIDRERVVRTFSKLNFRPTQERLSMLTKADGRKLILKFREKFKDGIETKCLVIYLKSHGGLHPHKGTMIYFSDEAMPLWDLLEPLLQLPQLQGVPKMVIYEACRGENAQYITAGAATPTTPVAYVHRRIDTILFAASPEAEMAVAGCHNEVCSPFTDALCRALLKNKSQDVFDLGIRVTNELRNENLTVRESDGTMHAWALAPVMESCLTKHLRLMHPNEEAKYG